MFVLSPVVLFMLSIPFYLLWKGELTTAIELAVPHTSSSAAVKTTQAAAAATTAGNTQPYTTATPAKTAAVIKATSAQLGGSAVP